MAQTQMTPDGSAILGCDAEVAAWYREILALSSSAIAIAKRSLSQASRII